MRDALYPYQYDVVFLLVRHGPGSVSEIKPMVRPWLGGRRRSSQNITATLDELERRGWVEVVGKNGTGRRRYAATALAIESVTW